MHCSVCRLPSAYNRAVVDTAEDEQLGCLCTRCTDEYFGRPLDRYESNDGTCILCDRDGFYALPQWTCRTVDRGTEIHIRGLDATVSNATPRLCERHFADLRDEKLRRADGGSVATCPRTRALRRP
jgi:hypothetical protein